MPADLLAAAAGLLAAASWGAGDFGGGLAAKRLPVFLALLGSQLVGLAVALVLALLLGELVPAPADAAWAVAAAVFGVLGLAGLYRALADGQMGVVAPITGVLTAAIPVAVGIAATGLPAPVRMVGFALAFVAILLVSLADDGSTGRGGLLLALGAGVSFGLYGTCMGQIEAGVFGPLAVSRTIGALLVLGIVVATRVPVRASFSGRPRLFGLLLLVGLLEIAGNALFLAGAQLGGLALAAVLASLYPVSTVLLAAVVLREPIGRVHAIGIATAAVAAMLIVGGGRAVTGDAFAAPAATGDGPPPAAAGDAGQAGDAFAAPALPYRSPTAKQRQQRSPMPTEIPDGLVMEPVFAIEATYGPDAAAIRPAHRPTHLARLAALRAAGVVLEAGAYPDMSGSLLLVRAADADAAMAIVAEDVYMREGVWVEARVRPFVRVARTDEVPGP